MIEVISVKRPALEGSALRAASIDTLAAGAVLPGYSIAIAGWAVASAGAVERIEILHGTTVVRAAPLSEPRADVLTTLGLPERDPAVGFRTRVSLLDLPLEATLRVAAKVGDERVELAELVIRREPLRLTPPPPLHPLVVTTLGRTGSTWFSRLVGEHPVIVSHRPFEAEPRMGSYWAHVFKALSDPASITQALAPQDMSGNWWLGSEGTGTIPPVRDPEILEWLVESHPERTARFCLESASDFYARVAGLQQKVDPVYYVEKYIPSFVPSMLLELDPGAKEVFLVRDPRDMLASMVSWVAAGRGGFAQAAEAEQSVDWLASQTKVLLRHWQERSARSLLVRYEDLVLEPLPTLTGLFDYLGVESTAETATTVLERALGTKPDQQRNHQTSNGPEQSVGRWQRDVRPDLWDRMNEAFAPELESWYGDSRFQEATVPGSGGQSRA